MNYRNPMSGLIHGPNLQQGSPLNGLFQGAEFALSGMGMGVDQAMANPVVKTGVLALAAFGAFQLVKGLAPKPRPRYRNPRRKRRKRR